MIRKYAEIFCWTNVSSFCSAKATHIFSAKNIRIMYIESAKTVNEMTLNELVKLTTLWTTGPRSSSKKKIQVTFLTLVLSTLVHCPRWATIRHFWHFSHLMTKPTKRHVRPARLRSAWTSTKSDQSLRCPHEESLGPYYQLGAQRSDCTVFWSD